VLAFRSFGTAIVFLLSRERRTELANVKTTWRKLRARVAGCVCGTRAPRYALVLNDHNGEFEMREMIPTHDTNNHSDAVAAAGVAATDTSSSWHISECNITRNRRLGHGSFGDVWEGMLYDSNYPEGRCVAIKTLFAGMVDEDGDLVDPTADEEFHKECAALQRINSPHLLKFFGCGFTESGHGFIVTELLAGGSLCEVLRDVKHDLPWRSRVAIGLQVALGMEHLHHKHMLHRDLKSQNVLLDEQLRAKVCDFGLSRVVRPNAGHHFVYSPFTGVTRLLPHVDNVGSDTQRALLLENMALSIINVSGAMSKAVGTVQWMAPEMFRGDSHYTMAVDVYSFGVLLYELASRKEPWSGELPDNELGFFCALNHALQTGRRPAIPDEVLENHVDFVAVMEGCWAGDPVDRPEFSEVVKRLAVCLRGTA